MGLPIRAPHHQPIFSLRHWQIWAISFVFWTVYASLDSAGSFALLALRGQAGVPLSQVLVWNFAEAYIWVLFTPVICAITVKWGFSGGGWKKSLLIHVVAGLLLMTLGAWLLLLPSEYLGIAPTRLRVLGLALQDLPRYFVTVAVTQIVLHYSALREREAESAQLEARLAQAQLENLRSQIQPHFLFNALNSIATLARKDSGAAERMTLQLAALLRVSVECVASQEIPLKQELEFLENYLDIQQTRFRDRLSVSVNVDPSLLSSPVPSLILQPLVENAIRHGIAKSAAAGYVHVTAARENGYMKIVIDDNGVGMNNGSGQIRDGLGLSNTRARLRQLYGEHHQFRIDSAEGRGCRVTLALPLGGRYHRG
jgi:two-component system LytT family sensor kinase